MNASERAEEIFTEALTVPSGSLTTFLLERCDGDDGMISEVRSLLASHFESGTFLEQPLGLEFSTSNGVPGNAERPEGHVGLRVGPYVLVKLLGTGGCGMVYLGEQETPVRRQVAVKIVRHGLHSREMLARFHAERQALALLDHPNIAKLFEAGQTDDGFPFFAMEYVNGAPLTQYCDQNHLGVNARLDLFVVVCTAVHHAHQRGIIHRDLKPSNILVAGRSEGGQPKVIDFGIAKSLNGPLTEQTLVTQVGVPIGTFDYMSPEQITGQAGGVDACSDVYSLGVILYELLTGMRPFELSQMSLAAAQRRVCEYEPPRVSAQVTQNKGNPSATIMPRELPGDLDWIVLKAMDKSPARRYMSVSELAADIERHRHNQPVEARPPSRLYRLRKFVIRNRAISVGTAIAVVALIAGTIASVLWAMRAGRAERIALSIADASRGLAYRNSILAAASSLERDPRRAKRSLEEAPKELRDWEWSYLHDRVEIARPFYQSEASMSAMAASSDGSKIAVGLHNGEILLWSKDEALPRTFRDHKQRIQSLAFGSDSSVLVSGASDGSVRVWDTHTGSSRIVGSHTKGVAAVAFDRSDAHVASGGADGTVAVWEAARAAPAVYQFRGEGQAYSVGFLGPNSETLVAGWDDGFIRTWNLSEERPAAQWKAASTGVRALAPIVAENELVTGGLDGSLILWNAETGQNLRTFIKRGSSIRSIAANVDGSLIAAGNRDGDTTVWSRTTGVLAATLPGQAGFVEGVAFVGNSPVVVTASWGGIARVWQVGPGQAKRQIGPMQARPMCVAFGDDPRQVASADASGYFGRWDVDSGLEVLGQSLPAPSVASADASGRWIVLGYGSGKVLLVDADTGETKTTLQIGERVTVTAVSADGGIVAAGGENGGIRTWEVASGALTNELKGSEGCTCLGVSPDGRYLAAGFRDGGAYIWNLRGGHLDSKVGDWHRPVSCVAFSPMGDRVAFGLQENSAATVRLLDTSGRKEVWAAGGTGYGVNVLAFSPSGHRIASGGDGHAVRLWNVTDGQELLSIQDLDSDTNGIGFSSDGRSLAVCTAAGSLLVYGGSLPSRPWYVTGGNSETMTPSAQPR